MKPIDPVSRWRIRPGVLGGIFVMALLAAPSVGTAAQFIDTTTTNRVGGSGGSHFGLQCRPGEVLIGVSGRYGMWLDGIRARCRQVTRSGAWTGTTRNTSWRGNSRGGTRSFTRTCGTNKVVSGLSIRYGSYVHGLKLRCSNLRADANHDNTAAYSSLGGRTASRSARAICPTSRSAIGLVGRAGSFVDRVGLKCGKIVPGPSRLSPRGPELTTTRPTFTWTIPGDRLTRSFRMCIGGPGRPEIQCSSRLNRVTTTWRPTDSFPRGVVVWGRIEACNSNGCTQGGEQYSIR
jgi:hypothetical protein